MMANIEYHLRFGVLTDLHLAPLDTPPVSLHGPLRFDLGAGLLTTAMQRLAEMQIDGLLVLGDLAHFGDEEHMRQVIVALGACPKPVWIVPGNHDLELDPDMISKVVEDHPTTVCISTTAGDLFAEMVGISGLALRTTEDGADIALGSLSAALTGDHPFTLMLSHFPVISRREAALALGKDFGEDLHGMVDMCAHLSSLSVPQFVVHGHFHMQDAVCCGTLLQFGFSSLVEAPHNVAVVDVWKLPGDVWRVEAKSFSAICDAPIDPAPTIQPLCWNWAYQEGQWRQLESRLS